MKRVVMGLFVVALLATGASAQPVVHQGDGWSIELPDGWEAISSGDLELLNAELGSSGDTQSIRYVASYSPSGEFVEGVYLLIQEIDAGLKGTTEAEYRRDFGDLDVSAIDSFTELGLDFVSDLTVGETVIENDSHRVLIRGGMATPLGRLSFLSFINPGQDKTVAAHWYAPEDQFDQFVPVFVGSADSFSWAAGGEWVPATGLGSSVWGRVLLTAIWGGVIGGIFAGVTVYLKNVRATRAANELG